MISKPRILTIADWEAMSADDGNRYEIIEGELFVSCSPGPTHQRVVMNLIFSFWTFLQRNPIGEVVTAPGVILSKYSGVIPDVVVFLNQTGNTIIKGERLTGPPDLVIEVISPGSANARRDRVDKLQLYSKHGVPEYWIVDPVNLTVEQYVSHGSSLNLSRTLQREEERLSSAAIPGFSCPLSQIFSRI